MNRSYNVDVVIPTYNPDIQFKSLIKKLAKQSFEVRNILVINTKAEHFLEEIEKTPQVQVIHIEKSQFDHGATRDMGFRMSNADVVVFMTQDAIPADEKMIEKLVTPLFANESIGVSYARQLPAPNCDVIERYTRKFNYPEESRIKSKKDLPELGIKTFFCSDVCAAYRRDIYEKMGGFCKKTIFNEDMILAGEMVLKGYKVAYAADARVIHSHNYTGCQQFHRNFDLAVSQVDHPEVFAGIQSESEGIKLVKKTTKYLLKNKKLHLIPVLIYKSGCKYIGYKLGQNYQKLPLWIIKKCSMSPSYWEKRQIF